MRSISVSATNVQIGGAGKSLAAPDETFRFVPAWRLDDLQLERHAKDFWRRFNLVREVEIDLRSKQVCAVAYAQGTIAAVATVEPLSLLQLRFLHYRCAVSPACRRHEMAWRLTAFAHSLLEQWSADNPQEQIAGLLATMQAREFVGHLDVPILPKHGLNLVFVGRTPQGHQLRAIWFKHANVEDTVQPAAPDSADLSMVSVGPGC